MAWTEDRVEELKRLWAEGLSASQIAARLGGITRNAVVGKVHRLGLTTRAAPAKPKTLASEAKAPAPNENKQPLRTVLRDIPQGADIDGCKLTVTSISDDRCKWPIGDPTSEDFHFCGQACAPGKPYCAYHTQIAFQPVKKPTGTRGQDLKKYEPRQRRWA